MRCLWRNLLLMGLLFSSPSGNVTRGEDNPVQVSGIYPRLAMFNNEGECGTGAVVPFAGRLWVITYGPHLPFGSSDKLYEITPDLKQIIRKESIGGTPANRLIHRETNQLAIGPYLINDQGTVRVITSRQMPGRLTGTARHLSAPADKLYYATMEEGLYEVDVRTLAVTGLIKDGNATKPGQTDEPQPANLASKLPGYHGKGLYTGQGRVVYANNGEHGLSALRDPTTPSGALAEWKGNGDWQLVRRNQFTEVTGPGGIYGNSSSTDPLWSIGWDARSLILMVLDNNQWHAYRLPKASHSYDGAHGWNTEWPRIRDVGEADKPDLLMTMHGTFWHFPKTFSTATSGGIRPRSNYLKVVGDFCRWKDQIVLGCDDTAKSEFLNKRKLKGELTGPGQSQSNLWFIAPERLDRLGPLLGRGAVWLNDNVKANTPCEPYLFAGYERRSLFLTHGSSEAVTFSLEVDPAGNGKWTSLQTVDVEAKGNAYVEFNPSQGGAWIRLTANRDSENTSAVFHYGSSDNRTHEAADMFAGIATPTDKAISGGLIYARGGDLRTLRFVAQRATEGKVEELGCYDLDENLQLRYVDDKQGIVYAHKNFAIPKNVILADEASVLFIDEQRQRWRLPMGEAAFDSPGLLGPERVDREVCTERDLMNVHGTFYELPAENAGGFAKIRPIASHNRRIFDYASYRGLLVLSGLGLETPKNNSHIIRSDDGKCALWVGAVDDLWQFGKPRGVGGPWHESRARANVPSDPYLLTGYDRKRLMLRHTAKTAIEIRAEVDITGNGMWVPYQTFSVPPEKELEHTFASSFGAYWIRFIPNQDCLATAKLYYE